MILKAWFLKYWLPIFLIIAFGFFIKPYLHDKISSNNHNLIITLSTIENWLEDGGGDHNFNLIHSWGKEGDHGIHYYPRVMSPEGRNYFVSYPPLSFITFYGAVLLFQPDNLVVFFKLFGVVIHCLTFVLIFIYLQKKIQSKAAELLSGLFLFFPSSIVLSNMYYPEQLILFLIVSFLIIEDSYSGKGKKVYVFILGFLMVYCDWLGGLVVGSYFLYLLLEKRKSYRLNDFSVIIGGILAGLVILFQYSSINGVEGLLQGLKVRYLERSGIFTEEYSDRGVNLFNSNSFVYLRDHLLYTTLGGVFVLLTIRPKWAFKKDKLIAYVVVFPVVLHMLVLFNSNILHFQNLSKIGVLFSLGLISFYSFKTLIRSVQVGLLILFIASSCWIVKSYFKEYPTATISYEKSNWIQGKQVEEIPVIMLQETFTEDLVLMSYLLKRNVIFKKSKEEVREFLKLDERHSSAMCFDWGNKEAVLLTQ